MKAIHAFAPASIGNFIVGFDSLGACLECIDGSLLGDIVQIEPNASTILSVKGKFAHKLPQQIENNLLTHATHLFHQKLAEKNLSPTSFCLTLEKNLPICSGLGSSATSIVATIFALNAFYEKPFENKDLLEMAGAIEGIASGSCHYDNVAPSLLGGLQLMVPQEISKPLPWFEEYLIVMAYPGIEISTKMAREILPTHYKANEVISYWQNLACFIDAVHTQDKNLLKKILQDNLIEPYRAKLIPNFSLGKKAALEQGALAFSISGSGPSCFALVDSLEKAKNVQTVLDSCLKSSDEAWSQICKISKTGARIIHHEFI